MIAEAFWLLVLVAGAGVIALGADLFVEARATNNEGWRNCAGRDCTIRGGADATASFHSSRVSLILEHTHYSTMG